MMGRPVTPSEGDVRIPAADAIPNHNCAECSGDLGACTHEEHASPQSQAPTVTVARIREARDRLYERLDTLHRQDQRLVDQFKVLGPSERRLGPASVVQFVQLGCTSDIVAVKFFLDEHAFSTERCFYADDQLRAMLPGAPTFVPNKDGAMRFPDGYVIPPHSVSDQCEPLHVWQAREEVDQITVIQVLVQVLRVLRALHRARIAHRAVKPSNVLRRRVQHDWLLADLARAQPFGSMLEPVDTSNIDRLMYAAPEILPPTTPPSGASEPPKQAQVEVSPAADVWAVGVIAYELLTSERVFPPGTRAHAVLSAIRGVNSSVNESVGTSSHDTQADATNESNDASTCPGGAAGGVRGGLPWEAHIAGSEERNARLRGLRGLILSCLDRDENRRPTSASLAAALEHAFDRMFTQGTFATKGQEPTNSASRLFALPP